MKTALVTGVKGGKWYSMMDKVMARGTLEVAWKRVKQNRGAPGIDHQTIEAFGAQHEQNLAAVERALQMGTYAPRGLRRVWIDKPGSREKRGLGIPTVRDRIVQTALKLVIEPIFETEFADGSHGFRPGRSPRTALRQVGAALENGAVWIVDVDLRRYFDTIPHEPLLARCGARIADRRVLMLIGQLLRQGVMEELEGWEASAGVPQGAVMSPLLANIYLDPLDHLLAAHDWTGVRYADDLVIMCRSREEAERALAVIQEWVADQGLVLHPDKTRIVDARERGGFDFLGYHFEQGRYWPRRESRKRCRALVRAHTRRTSGESMEAIIAHLNPILRGWYTYYRYGSGWSVYRDLDGYVRGRLRSILRKRAGRTGRGRGRDHQRWPNTYFTERGLFTMQAARRAAGLSR
ncbi:MAG: group II intron reverse transcriptase/maturase [Actinobacteria bacterium]|nr:group II intron reverse transcriptase/maturase [Actinomycetota bacterium]